MNFVLMLLASLLIAPFSSADSVRTAHVEAELTTEREGVVAGAGFENWIGLRLEMQPHWHTYWQFPGDTGLPTKVKFQLPKGWEVSEAVWPLPERILLPPLVNFGFSGEALLGFRLKVPANEPEGERNITASASWLVCKEECIPEKAELQLKVKVMRAEPKLTPWANLFTNLRKEQPQKFPVGEKVRVLAKNGELGLELPPSFQLTEGTAIDFFPLAPEVVKGDRAPRVERVGGITTLWLELSSPFSASAKNISGLLVLKGSSGSLVSYSLEELLPAGVAEQSGKAPPSSPVVPVQAGSIEILWSLLFAFLGGLVLNLMPCVFPVLGIKVMSLVKHSGHNARQVRIHGKTYALGVLVSFWLLAGLLVVLRAAGEAVGWGFQLQQPGFLVVLIFLFAFIAADLAGFVRWSGGWMGAGANLANKEGYLGSIFTGILAVVVATPCTAPFMGTAIGAAIGQPAWIVLLIFSSLGLGLALPFVLLSYQPKLLSALPRPGAWMNSLKEFFAFPMVLTVFWLLWVLTQQVGQSGAFLVEVALLCFGAVLWLGFRFRASALLTIVKALLLIGALGLAVTGAQLKIASGTISNAASEADWKVFSESAVAEAVQAGKPVFVDFTAAWCLTCQLNKKLVLDRSSMHEFFREKGVVLFLADWTNRDEAITRALEKHGRIGVPLYLAYNKDKGGPVELPQLLTENIVRSAFP